MKSLLTISFDIRDSSKEFLRTAAEAMWRDQYKAMVKASQVLAGEIRRSIKQWVSSSDATNVRRSGQLARSFVPQIELRDVREIAAKVTSKEVYAGIHEDGGTIKSRGKLLTIPLKRLPANYSARDVKNPVFIRSKKGNLLLAEQIGQGKKARLDFKFVLKPQVTIKAKHYLARAEETALLPIQGVLQDQINLTVSGVNRG